MKDIRTLGSHQMVSTVLDQFQLVDTPVNDKQKHLYVSAVRIRDPSLYGESVRATVGILTAMRRALVAVDMESEDRIIVIHPFDHAVPDVREQMFTLFVGADTTCQRQDCLVFPVR